MTEDPHAKNRRLAASRLAKVVWNGYVSVLRARDDDVKVSEALDNLRDETWDFFADLVRVGTPVSPETRALVKEMILAHEGDGWDG